MKYYSFIIAFLVSFAVLGQQGKKKVTFIILDAKTEKPIPNAKIVISDNQESIRGGSEEKTDLNGYASFFFSEKAVGMDFNINLSSDGYINKSQKITVKKILKYNEHPFFLEKESSGSLLIHGVVMDQDSNFFSGLLGVKLYLNNKFHEEAFLKKGYYEFSIPKDSILDLSTSNYIEFVKDSILERKTINDLIAYKDSTEYKVADVHLNHFLNPPPLKKVFHIPGIYHLKEGKNTQGYLLNTLFWGGICTTILSGVFRSKEIVKIGEATTIQNKWFHEDRADRLLATGLTAIGTSLICVGINYNIQFRKNNLKKKLSAF